MKQQTKITATVIVATVVAIGAIIAVQRLGPSDATNAASTADVVRSDSHRLNPQAPEGSVTVTEFLDFECEACGAAYPYIEQLREKYKGRVTFVLRYFPGPSHANARNAAHAVEAAARQDQLESMYSKMFQTQQTWGESRDSQAPLFRQYAEELGLDMDAYDSDVASDAVAQRVQKDFDEGIALGVDGTPTFFVQDQKVEIQTGDELVTAIDRALEATD